MELKKKAAHTNTCARSSLLLMAEAGDHGGTDMVETDVVADMVVEVSRHEDCRCRQHKSPTWPVPLGSTRLQEMDILNILTPIACAVAMSPAKRS